MNFDKMTIKEIKRYIDEFENIEKIADSIVNKLNDDSRKGVNKIADKIIRQKEKKQEKIRRIGLISA